MKKLFIEPKMKRIELNIKENIASSGGGQHIVDCVDASDMINCFITGTEFKLFTLPQDIAAAILAQCTVYQSASEETVVSVDEAMKYMGW